MKKRIQIFIDHDIIIRHFILNHTFAPLEALHHVQYVFPDNKKRVTVDLTHLKLQNIRKIAVDWRRLAMLRELAKIRNLRIARQNRQYNSVARLYTALMKPKDFACLNRLSLPGFWQWHKHRVVKMAGPFPELEAIIDAFNPDLLIHPTVLDGYFITDLGRINQERRIPFLALMNSWDNPSTKAGALYPPQYLFVWGEQTRRHAREFLGMDNSHIIISGPAQFEVYRQPPTKDRTAICAEIGIGSYHKLILYAGSSKSVNEIKHLQLMEQSVADGTLAGCHIIFRPHPWRAPAIDEPDFFDIPWQHVSMDPSMQPFYIGPKQTPKKQNLIHLTDYMDTHNILSAIDLLVSNVSTIFIEAAMHGKPLLCLISDKDVADSLHLNFTINTSYFNELLQRLDVPRCHEATTFTSHCRSLLDQAATSSYADMQRSRAHYFAELPPTSYPQRLLQFVEEFT
ncbi:conserved hypothetical protein [Desulfovibrionales bacterium]